MESRENPLISVLMGVYYRQGDTALLRRSVESILSQSCGDLELLICDEGSSPEALALTEGFAAQDRRVRLVRPGCGFDLASKLNACLHASRGAYIARMDDDDRSDERRFDDRFRSGTACDTGHGGSQRYRRLDHAADELHSADGPVCCQEQKDQRKRAERLSRAEASITPFTSPFVYAILKYAE